MPAVSYQSFERRVRALLRDTRPSDYVCDPDMMFHAVARALQSIADKINPPPALSTSFITLAANTYRYTVGAGFSSGSFSSFRLSSTGQPIVKVDLPVLMKYRTGSTVDTGDPLVIALEATDGAGSYKADFWPTPWQADTVEAVYLGANLYYDSPSNLAGREIYSSSVVTIDVPGSGDLAVLYRAAMELTMMLGQDKLEQLGLNPRAVEGLNALYEDALAVAVGQQHKLRRAGQPVVRNPF